ncbi:SMI1/KNR4 family protein [Bacillus sp. FJAT-29814]|uniref:SMI1/KNR4 family protein n=1 Tax=Bacillus sp. FJAT-29814 TaxID=1729688 RepID=UPI00083018F8|nr:SMI1/KNR4 family protein [Bacillus sp. FJAT-29814]
MSEQFFKRIAPYIPNLNEYLNDGASDISMLEKETGFTLPDSFKALYSIHNGDKDYIGLFFGLDWLSIDDILFHWKNNKKWHNEFSSSDIVSFEKGKIKEEYYHPGWLPIAYDGGGNYIGFDFSPGPDGTVGQIISFGRDEEKLFVISNSFQELLDLLIQQFECGNCRVVDEDEPHVAWREEGHFFDDLQTILVKK